jgi:hypothetical protein
VKLFSTRKHRLTQNEKGTALFLRASVSPW